ncbi:alpha/beta hydrolase [Serratia proteamaculans]|uniref:alpha/beta hydrolase n=1 Tax=Serratia proteamaculans TaxID=28151 RepID=UPI001076713A|nr:alpha/beta hydrolase [Serratia proteamaculans]TFZ50922.1 alpha/beta hydrolase [Serratia proteamaculans]
MKEETSSAITKKDLIVLLHGFNGSADNMKYINAIILNKWRRQGRSDPILVIPSMPLSLTAFSDPYLITKEVFDQINSTWENNKNNIEDIYFIGHSTGALIARKVYIYACGQTPRVPFDPLFIGSAAVPWASRVKRIVLLSAMNRGWTISPHLSLKNAFVWGIGNLLGNIIMMCSNKIPLVFNIRRGAPFLTQLRLEWMAMRRRAAESPDVAGSAITVQLLGTIDDMVSPEDNIDLVAGDDFYYFDVPGSGHSNIIETNDTPVGNQRRRRVEMALTASKERLEQYSILPADHNEPTREPRVTDVVFVIHGIRDQGYWTQKIARRVVALARARNKNIDKIMNTTTVPVVKTIVKTETSSYGYFAMLPFLLPHIRRRRVEWLLDRYATNQALYPNAEFSFIGHSHGTYMLAKALQSYSGVYFKHVIFAGSVVRTDFDWKTMFHQGRVKTMVNFVATADWVVALFPKTFQTLSIPDLGSAGHDGFNSNKTFNLRYVTGEHSAALQEKYWRDIARFILDGKVPTLQPAACRQSRIVRTLGTFSPLVLLAILAVALGLGAIFYCLGSHLGQGRWGEAALAIYLLLIWKVVTWF